MSSDSRTTESQILAHRLILCDTIRIVREQRGYTQEQLAEMMSISRSTISKIENGKFSISIDYLIKFSIFFDHQFVVV